ncbi:glycoside hydrolase [Arsenicitalea aurantiaca]|uniref:Lysozyme n=1 Tax=Arsenicitalea aurantiaca TaxID=1783274 RepID=A0A433X7Y7_9HYPH|nr:GH25 family lysozyme [Arsenicitalea aurantiaca]RUT30186.1 glycoside hydrolase [Arsenicitalea aurantiaca]
MALSVFRPFILFSKALLLIGLVVLIAACARSPHSMKGDNSPHDGVRRAWSLPIHGIDVARYQGRIDFHAARRAGTQFVFMKATEGGDYIDPMFYENWNAARNAGVPRGAYHFMTWCRPAHEQAAWFAQMVPNDPDALPPVLDLEWNNHSRCKPTLSRDEALGKIAIMLQAMERHTGKLPIIYTDINFHRDILEGVHLDNAFWLRSTAAEPHERYNNRPWTFWQWTQTGTVPGIDVEVDRNAFYGSPRDWQTFLLTGCDPRALNRLRPQGRCITYK